MILDPLHADARSDRVDPLVVGLDSHLGALARYTDNLLDGDEAIEYLRNLMLEEFLKELVGCSGKSDVRGGVVLHLHALDDGAEGVSLLESLSWNLLGLRQMKLIVVIVKDDDLLRPSLVDLTREYLADLVGICLEYIRLVDVHDAALKVLPDVQDSSSTERREGEFLRVHVSDLVVVITGLGLDLIKSDLCVRILHLLDHIEVLVDLAVSLVNVDDDIEIVGRAIGLGDLGEEHVLEHTHHHRSVDVLLFLEVLEGVNKSDFFFLFHIYILDILIS